MNIRSQRRILREERRGYPPPSSGYPPRCGCGAVLPAPNPKGGRPRFSCSRGCGRRRERALKKIARREQQIAIWNAELGRGDFTRKQIRSIVRSLRGQIRRLRAAMIAAADVADPPR